MLRLLLVLWVASAVLVAVLRHRAGGFRPATLRGDLMAAFMVGTFVFLLVAVVR